MEHIFNAYMPVIHEIDVISGLPLFMLAATGPTSNIESAYNLLKEYPVAISIHQNNSIPTVKRRGGAMNLILTVIQRF